MQSIQAVLFDLDGTLIDSIDHIIGCWQYASRSCLGREMTRDEIIPTLGRPLIECFEEIAPGRSQDLLAAYREEQRATHDLTVKLVPGTTEALALLRDRGIPLGVVTSKGIRVAREGLALFDLEPFFGLLVTMEDSLHHKPHPEPLLFASERLGIEPAATLYVGDAVVDILAGRAAGMLAAGVTWGASTPEAMKAAGANYIIDHMLDLPDIVTAGALHA